MNTNNNYVYQTKYGDSSRNFIKTSGTSNPSQPPQYINPTQSHRIQRIKNFTSHVDQFFGSTDQQGIINHQRSMNYGQTGYPIMQRSFSPHLAFNAPNGYAYYKPVRTNFGNTGMPLRIQPPRPQQHYIPMRNQMNPRSHYYHNQDLQGTPKIRARLSREPKYYDRYNKKVFKSNFEFPENSGVSNYRSKSTSNWNRSKYMDQNKGIF